MAGRDKDAWFVLIKTRTRASIALAAATLQLLMMIWAWGDWPRFWLAVGFGCFSFVFNAVVDVYVGRRVGPRLEYYVTIANIAMGVPIYHLLGWSLPCWFWLGFIAITIDTASTRASLVTLLLACVIGGVSAVTHGVAPLFAIAFCVFSITLWQVGNRRNQLVREMVIDAETKRDELAQMHADLERAHEGLKAEIAARERAEVELRSAQKLEAIGRLAAGVAHEINTPMQFVSDSLEFVTGGANDLLKLARLCATSEQAEHADLAYLDENMPTALAHAHEGVKRVAAIVRSMKEFAHPGTDTNAAIDLNTAIHNTLTIANHEIKLVADVEVELGELPAVHGNMGELNQVLLNIIVNAAHAIADRCAQTGERGKITIVTGADASHVTIRIRDTGAGIPAEIRGKIFEPFFTTKKLGRGTGQGLAIARSVVERHGGELAFETELGVGTTFIIKLVRACDVAVAA